MIRPLIAGVAIACCMSAAQAGAQTISLSAASQSYTQTKFNPQDPKKPGICIEIAHAIERIDPEIRFTGLDQRIPLPRILALLAAGKLDVHIGLIRTPQRELKIRYLNQGLFATTQTVAARIGDKVEIRNMDDIRKLAPDNIIIVASGTAFEETLRRQNGLAIDADAIDIANSLQKLALGRGRFVYDSNINLQDAIHSNHLEGKLHVLPVTFEEDMQYLAVRSTLDPAVAARLESDLVQLEKSGELKRIFARYLEH